MRTYERSWWWVKQKKQMSLVFITVTMILQFQMKGCVGCVETERVGLLQLKSYFNTFRSPEEGGFLESWSLVDPKSDCCKWKRVECTGGHVVNLSLYEILPRSAYLNQPLPLNLSLLHSFPQLKTLQLSENGFGYLFDPIHATNQVWEPGGISLKHDPESVVREGEFNRPVDDNTLLYLDSFDSPQLMSSTAHVEKSVAYIESLVSDHKIKAYAFHVWHRWKNKKTHVDSLMLQLLLQHGNLLQLPRFIITNARIHLLFLFHKHFLSLDLEVKVFRRREI